MPTQVHVTPNNDGFTHILSRFCPCEPYAGKDGRGIENPSYIIHQAQDERPPYVDVYASVEDGKRWTTTSKI